MHRSPLGATAALILPAVAAVACAGARPALPADGRPAPPAASGPRLPSPLELVPDAEPIPGFAPRDSAFHRLLEARFTGVPAASSVLKALRVLTARPRLAGSDGSAAAATWLHERLENLGLDAGLWTFTAPLPRPARLRLTLLPSFGAPVDVTPGEDPLPELSGLAWQELVSPYLAFSPDADLEAEIVYAHRGRPEDHDTLERLGVPVAGRILLVRAGAATPAALVAEAARRGAAAILLGRDVADRATGTAAYPRGPGQAADASPRGALPATAGRVPAVPIAERETRRILESLGGTAAPDGWQGEFPFPYRTGPGPARLRLQATYESGPMEAVNVLARIEGSDWPNQVVVLGAARDAWGFGAAESGSAVAALYEIARGLAVLQDAGWRPRRTLLLAAWDGSAFHAAGARAWFENGPMELARTAVAVLDSGGGMSGSGWALQATAELRVLLSDVVRTSAAGPWTERREARAVTEPDGRHDDRVSLAQGVPTVRIARPGGAGPAAGTAHDTLHRLRRFEDPKMVRPAEGAQLWGRAALRLADAALPPHNHAVTANRLLVQLQEVMDRAESAFDGNPPPVTDLRLGLLALRRAAEDWNAAAVSRLREIDSLPRGESGGRIGAQLRRAAELSLSVNMMFRRAAPARGGCASLIWCPDPEGAGPATPLPGLQAAVRAASRERFVAEALGLATVAQAAARRLQAATAALNALQEPTAERSATAGQSTTRSHAARSQP